MSNYHNSPGKYTDVHTDEFLPTENTLGGSPNKKRPMNIDDMPIPTASRSKTFEELLET
jgi:hypothetical protein